MAERRRPCWPKMTGVESRKRAVVPAARIEALSSWEFWSEKFPGLFSRFTREHFELAFVPAITLAASVSFAVHTREPAEPFLETPVQDLNQFDKRVFSVFVAARRFMEANPGRPLQILGLWVVEMLLDGQQPSSSEELAAAKAIGYRIASFYEWFWEESGQFAS